MSGDHHGDNYIGSCTGCGYAIPIGDETEFDDGLYCPDCTPTREANDGE